MSEEADPPVPLRGRCKRVFSEHVPRIVDLSLLTIQNRDAVLEGAATGGHSPGHDDVLMTPGDDVGRTPGDDVDPERCGPDDDEVLLRCGDENRAPGGRSRSGSSVRPRKISGAVDQMGRRQSLVLKRYSEPTELFGQEREAEKLLKRHSGTEGILKRCSGAEEPLKRRSITELLKRFSVPDLLLKRHSRPEEPLLLRGRADEPIKPPPGLDLPLKRRSDRALSLDSDSSQASFHTATQSPMCEAPPKVPRVLLQAEPREPKPAVKPGLEPEPEPEPARQRADSWRAAAAARPGAVSVRARIGQIERELGELAELRSRRPLGPARAAADSADPSNSADSSNSSTSSTRWYSNQNEDDHVYFFKEGSTSSLWALPPAENGASQNAKDTEAAAGRVVPVGGVPSVLQVARGQRGRSLLFPPPPSEPPKQQLVAGNQTHVILNQGTLNHTKLAKETSWRARKSWAPCRVVLTDRSLFLFKDTKGTAGVPQPGGSVGHRPDTTVHLAGAFVDWDSELSSRKNVFQIRTVRGLRLLLQDDKAITASLWFDAIQRAITEVPSSTNQLLSTRPPPGDDRLTRSRSVRFTGPAGPGSQEDISRDNSTIRDRLRRFFRARPAADSLVSRGILKDEPVFGGHLAALCHIEGSTVPRFVSECVMAIEAKPEHMKMDGVYRASGNLSQVQRIRCEVDQDNYQVLWDEEDVHVLTGALKLFFRELKEPLVPFAVLPEALRAAGLASRADQVTAFRRLVADLPPPNRDTLRAVLGHLSRVTELQEFNRMHAHNLAIVFGPTLMWPEQESPDLALDLMKQNRVVEALLESMADVFDAA